MFSAGGLQGAGPLQSSLGRQHGSQPRDTLTRRKFLAAFAALVSLVLASSPQPEDPPEIEVQPTVNEREIAFDGEPMEFECAPVKLVGTLTLPTHYDAPHPAVLLLSGAAGMYGRSPSVGLFDGTMREIAHHLANKGFASFRYEHRSAVRYDEQMPFPMSDLSKLSRAWDFASHRGDAAAAFDVLRGQAEIRTDQRPLILGHHLGGTLALSIAPTRYPAGLMLLSTPGRPVAESLVRSFTKDVESRGFSEEARTEILADLQPVARLSAYSEFCRATVWPGLPVIS